MLRPNLDLHNLRFEYESLAFLDAADLDALMHGVRASNDTARMASVTLAAEFDALCDALAEARGMPVAECYEHLRRAGAGVPMDSQLKVWWLRSAREAMIEAAFAQEKARATA